MARRRLLFHQLLALAAASLLLAAFPVHATLPSSPNDASGAEYSGAPLLLAASPAHHATPPSSPDDASAPDSGALLLRAASPVHATPPSPITLRTARGPRRLGPPRHVLLSDVPVDAEAPAPAPSHSGDDCWFIFALLLGSFVIILTFFGAWVLLHVFAWLFNHGVPLVTSFVAGHYAAARSWLTAARKKASGRVRPLDQDAVAAGDGGGDN